MDGEWIFIAEKGDKELWYWNKKDPSGKVETFIRGKVFMIMPDGSRKQTPNGPFFNSVAEGRAWLAETA